jgi:Domain of unknown function (DUF4440)
MAKTISMANSNHRRLRTFTRPGYSGLFSLFFSVSSVVMVLALLGCTIGKESKHPTWKNATGAEQYERLMWQAIRDKDWKEVEYRLAPVFAGVNARGELLDRGGWVDYWKAAPVKDFSLAEVVVRPNASDMTVTYILHLNAEPAAGLRVVSVWQQVKGGWILVATSQTPIQTN